MINTYVVLGLDRGDEGKGKIISKLFEKNNFNRCFRFNGSHNAGHTFYLNNNKIITHIIPIGILHNVRSIIGCGCVINEKSFHQELEEISKLNPQAPELIKIAYNAHVVQDKHINEEQNESRIGTTKRGIGPAYRDKHDRSGIRAENIKSFEPFLVDVYDEIYRQSENLNILCEGAQAMGLDIDHCVDYPFCTSSSCGVGEVINNGIPLGSINNIEGVIKAYSTYVGSKQFQDPNDPVLVKIGDVGKEFGATTGRRRQCNWLDLDLIVKYANMNSCNILHINKMDVLNEVGVYKFYLSNVLLTLDSEENFKHNVELVIKQYTSIDTINWYYSP